MVVDLVRRALRGSMLVHGGATAVRFVISDRAIASRARRSSSVLLTRLMPATSGPASGRVATIADGSLLGGIERFFERSAVALQESVTKHTLEASLSSTRSLEAQRVGLAGWFALGAATTHILVSGIGALVAGSWAGAGWLVAIPFSLVCILRPEAVVAAWRGWRARYTTRWE